MTVGRTTSNHISLRTASNLHHATRFAGNHVYEREAKRYNQGPKQPSLDLPLTDHVTINFTLLGRSPDEVALIFQVLRAQRFAVWLRRHPKNIKKVAATYVWVQEGASKQAAIHWAVHIPPELRQDFLRLLPFWIASVVDAASSKTKRVSAVAPVQVGVVKVTKIYNMTGLKRYLLKGMDPVYAPLYKIKHIPQGRVVGRRSGFSQNLGPAARKAAGYKSGPAFWALAR
jgi:hypothetical protein